MTFSIKATIRALAAPDHKLNCSNVIWERTLADLHRRSELRHESGVFLLGHERATRRDVVDTIFYDDLDPHAYATGVCVLRAEAFARLWVHCRMNKLTVVGDIHTHPERAFQSESDRMNPMVARRGHIAIIIPKFAAAPVRANELVIFEYCGNHLWIDRSPKTGINFIYSGFWS